MVKVCKNEFSLFFINEICQQMVLIYWLIVLWMRQSSCCELEGGLSWLGNILIFIWDGVNPVYGGIFWRISSLCNLTLKCIFDLNVLNCKYLSSHPVLVNHTSRAIRCHFAIFNFDIRLLMQVFDTVINLRYNRHT